MSSLAELKAETTLAAIAMDPEVHHHSHLFAVIIDVSEPHRSEANSNFNTRLKVIDPSFNYKAEVKAKGLKFHKFVYINIYSETPEAAPKVNSVGDIIRLRRFRFKHTVKGEVLGNEVNFSNWLIYPAIANKNDNAFSYKAFSKNLDRALTRDEANRVSDLRKWSQTFFGNNSVMYINWWTGYKETEDSKVKEYSKVDLILKVKSVHSGKVNKLTFIDRDNKNYELTLNDKPTLKEGNIIKLRCVEITVKRDKDVTRSIKVTAHSSCLNMPAFSSDYKQFDKAVQEQKRSPAKSTKTVDPFINDYQIDEAGQTKSSKSTPKKGPKGREDKFVTAFKKSYNTKKASSIEELQKVLKNPHQHHGQKFVFKGHIVDYSTTEPTEIIKFTHIDDRKVIKYGEALNHPKKLRAIYSFVLQVQDESGESESPLNVYILTGDYNSHLFSLWKILPEFDDIPAWSAVKQNKLNEFQKKLEAIRGADNAIRLVLELDITKKGSAFFKLVDTIFLA